MEGFRAGLDVIYRQRRSSAQEELNQILVNHTTNIGKDQSDTDRDFYMTVIGQEYGIVDEVVIQRLSFQG